MTNEMFRSDDPWAIAVTLMLFRPSAWKTFPETPGVPFIPSPTMATMVWLGASSSDVKRLWSSNLNSSATARRAAGTSDLLMAKQMVCSEEACEIRMTLTLWVARALNRRSEVPGTPTMFIPRREKRAISSTELIPLATPSQFSERSEINVPGADGFRVFLMRIGMFLATAGAIVAEWSTFAPK